MSTSLTVTLDRGPGASYAIGQSITICAFEQVYVPANTEVVLTPQRLQLVLRDPNGQRSVVMDTWLPHRFVGPGGAAMGSDPPACYSQIVTNPTGQWSVSAQIVTGEPGQSATPAAVATPPLAPPPVSDDFTVIAATATPQPSSATGATPTP